MCALAKRTLFLAIALLLLTPVTAQDFSGNFVVKAQLDVKIDGTLGDDGLVTLDKMFTLVDNTGIKTGNLHIKGILNHPISVFGSDPASYNLLTGTAVVGYSIAPQETESLILKLDMDYTGQLNLQTGELVLTLSPPDGVITLVFMLDEFEDEPTDSAVMDNGFEVGRVNFDPSNVEVVEPEPVVLMFLSGSVRYNDGVPVQTGEVTIIRREATTEAVVSNGNYEAIISGIDGAPLRFVVNGNPINIAEPVLIADGTYKIDLVLPIPSSTVNFPDDDMDGVPDNFDKCLGSRSSIVDVQGCDCDQKSAGCRNENLGCIEQEGIAVCAPTCYDGIQNQDETDVDCGGSCISCEPVGMSCQQPDACLEDKPNWCSPDQSIEPNCGICGCPEGFFCDDGKKCTQGIERQGLKCPDFSSGGGMNFEYRIFPYAGADCKRELGIDWENVAHTRYIKASVSSMPGGLSKVFRKKAKKAAKRAIRSKTLCVRFDDIGCVSPEARCFSEKEFEENRATAQAMIQAEINSILSGAKKSVSGFERFLMKLFRIKVKIKVNLGSMTRDDLEVTYECAPLNIQPGQGCRKIIDAGSSAQKADLVFVGDGYYTEQELVPVVNALVDLGGSAANTRMEGLFSTPPFRNHKYKFNVWIVPAQNRISRVEDTFVNNYGLIPDRGDALGILAACPAVDYAVVVSRTDPYRSSCMWSSVPPFCRISLAREEFPGRLVAHELGHGIGRLGDEYYEPAEIIQQFGALQASMYVAANCKANRANAETAWSVEGAVGYFPSCGGDQGSAEAIRPTFNSVMNSQWLNCPDRPSSPGIMQPSDEPGCVLGPPFNPWHPINAQEIEKELSKYS